MAEISDEHISAIVGKVASALNFSKWEFSKKNFQTIGQNYFGVLIPIDLIGMVNSDKVSVPLVLKLAPTDEKYRVSGAVTAMFSREIFVYSTLIKHYQVQQQVLNVDMSPFVVPTCYYFCRDYCQESLALKDMSADGYRPYTLTMFLDYKHVSLSLISLARFHAHSFVLRNKNIESYEEVANVCPPLTLTTNKRLMEVMEDRLNKAIEKFENTNYANIFKNLKQNQVRFIEAVSNSVKDTCICHCDMWKENILFKYENNEPVSACLIDYQTVRLSSPAYDVLYLITTSVDSILRQQHFEDMLDVYYAEFDKVLKQAGLESQKVYDRLMFGSDLKTVAPACLIVANTALWLANGLQQEGHVRSKQVWITDKERTAAVESYKNILKSIIDDFSSYKYLCFCNS